MAVCDKYLWKEFGHVFGHGYYRSGGRRLARTLLAEGENVRAVARDASKAAPWVERGCDLALPR